uniref:Hypothetical chloroplast RF21 n=1 Tax=Gastrodia javanica TaxID=2974003 RepID=A0A976YH28_9ASPA|nr:hypothetical chloroplast RF21 [Gastrodia javanica]UVG40902.1 hypothetical chloroplast RF21 [Gastrodia javanica]
MKRHKIKSWMFELIDIKNSRFFFYSWINCNLGRFLTQLFLLMVLFLSRISIKSRMITKKDIYLINLLPIFINSNFYYNKNDLKELFLYFFINKKKDILLPIKKKNYSLDKLRWNILFNIQDESIRLNSMQVIISNQKENSYSDKFIDLCNYLKNKKFEPSTLIDYLYIKKNRILFYRYAETKEIVDLFQLIISLKKKTLFHLVPRFKVKENEQKTMDYILILFSNVLNSEYILLKRTINLFILLITEPYLMYFKYFDFSIDPYLFKDKGFFFIKYFTYLNIRINRFFILKKKYQRRINKIGNHIIILRYKRNKHLLNFQNIKIWFEPLISKIEIQINQDFYSFKKFDSINNLSNLFFYQKNTFKKIINLILNRLRINKDRLKSISKADFYEFLFFLFLKSLNFLFVSIGNVHIYRYKLHVYIKKSLKNKFFLKYMYLKRTHFFKKNPLLAYDHNTLKKNKYFIKFNEKIFKNKKDSHLATISHDQGDLLEKVQKISLITYFYKMHKFKFFKNKNHFCFYYQKLFTFPLTKRNKKKSYIKNYIYIILLDNFILSIRNNLSYLSVSEKEYFYSKKYLLLPIKLRLFEILRDINLSQDDYDYKLYNLYNSYKYLHLINIINNIRSVKDIYLIEDFFSISSLTEEQSLILEKNNYKSISDRNTSHFERNNLYQYLVLNLNSKMGLKYTSLFINYLSLPFIEKIKERDISICKKEYIKNDKMYKKSHQDQKISYVSRWDKLQIYMPWLFTFTGFKYIKSIYLYSISEIFFSNIKTFIHIFYSIPKIANKLKFITHKLIINLQYTSINEIFTKFLQNLILSEESIHRKKDLYFCARPISKNTCKFLYLIFFFFITSGYIICTHLLFFYQSSNELQKELKKIKSLIIPSYMMGFQKLLYRYPIYKSEFKILWLKDLFLVFMEQLGDLLENFQSSFFGARIIFFRGDNKLLRYWDNFFIFVNRIPNPINRILFTKNTIYLSKRSKDLFYLLSKSKKNNVKKDWMDDKIEIWVSNSVRIFDEDERRFLVQFLKLNTDKKSLIGLNQIDHDLLSKNIFSYKISEQPGFISLCYLLNMHQRDLITYILKKSLLLEKHIFLAHYNKINYSQVFYEFNKFFHKYNEKPFSIRLSLSYKGVLMIGSIGTGRSSLIKYLTKNSSVPLIVIFLKKFLEYNQKKTKFFDPFDKNYNYNREEEDFDIDIDIKMLTMSTASNLDQLGLILQIELAKRMSPCIIWIPKIHYLQISEVNYFSLGILDNYLFRNIEISSYGKILVLASTHIPKKVDPTLIATNRLNKCIKIRGFLLSQQRKQFFIISYTRGFYFEKKIFQNKIFLSLNTGSFSMSDIITFIDEALSLSITQNDSNIKINKILSAFHIRNWYSRSQIRFVQNKGILLYQIGRAFIKNCFISDCFLDPISVYNNYKNKYCIGLKYFLHEWYFELGKNIKRLTILIYIFICSAGSVAQDLFYLQKDENRILYYEFFDNEFDIVKGLLQLEIYWSMNLSECLSIGKEFSNNNKITLFNRLKSKDRRDWFNLIKNGYCSIIYNQFNSFEKNNFIFLLQTEEDFGNTIVWAPRIWRLCDNIFFCMEKINELGSSFCTESSSFWKKNTFYKGNELHEKDSKYLYLKNEDQLRDKYISYTYKEIEHHFLQKRQFFLYPADTIFYLVKDQHFISFFLRRKLFSYEDFLKGLVAYQTKFPASTSKNWFIKKEQRDHLDFLFYNQRLFIINRINRPYFSNFLIISESYQYLLNTFLYKKLLFDKIRNYLLRKKWIFSDEIKRFIYQN